MSLKKSRKEEEAWKSDQVRKERKERLAKMKSKDGYKKPIRDSNRIVRVVSILLVVAIVLGFGVWFALQNGLRQKYTKAFTVRYDAEATDTETDQVEAQATDETETKTATGNKIGDVTLAEANILLGLVSQQYLQGGAFSQQGQDALSQDSMFNPEGTLRDDFLLSVENEARNSTYFYWKAKEEGLTLDDADRESIDNVISQYEAIASQGQVTLNHYLGVMFGPGVTESVFRDFMEKSNLGNKYVQQVFSTFTHDADEISAIYDENPDSYNEVNYRSYLFTGNDEESPAVDPTVPQAQPEVDLEAAKTEADEFVDSLSDEASFKIELDKLGLGTQEGQDPDADLTLTKGGLKNYMSPEMGEWLFAEERQAEDVTVLEEAGGYRVVMFLEKYKPVQIGSYDSRHILVLIDENDPEKSDEKSKAKIEEILAEYRSGEQTEEAFAELAKEYSEDQGSAANGGLTEKIAPGQFVPEYEEYCMDPERKPGDVEIVKTTYGYHLIYFIESQERWYASIEQELLRADQQEFLSEVNLHTNITQEKGIKYFGKP
ncbi:MAG: peptidylprolyl isomerase [Bacillota bacterium]|nr:peptidylprolyl isomerase [Bacillota bacterium]